MSQWDGKSKAGVLGYKFFVFCIRKLGIKASYTVLHLVSACYFLFLWNINRATYYYFHNRLGYSPAKAIKHVYLSYYTYGRVLIDKVAIGAGMRKKFSYEFDGIENLRALLEEKRGGILISAHIGNFEIAQYFFSDLTYNVKIHLVISDMEHRAIKEYLERISTPSAISYIIIKEDLSHVFEISNALADNDLVCFTGDRYLEGVKFITSPFLGKEANFSAGPFLIASRLQVPVVFVYVMKEKNRHYHLYARVAQVKKKDEKELLKAYISNLQEMIHRYPLQWFNYFDFWNAFKK